MVLAFFVIIIRRKYDQSQDFEKDGPKSFEQGDHSEVELLFFDCLLSIKANNSYFKKALESKSYTHVDRVRDVEDNQKINQEELKELKLNRIIDKKLLSIIKEINFFLVFLGFLYFVSFANLSSSSLQFNKLYQSSFVNSENSLQVGLNDVKIH